VEFLIWTVIELLALVCAAVLTAEEVSSSLLSRSRVRRLVDTDRPGALALESLADKPSRIQASAEASRAAAFSSFGLGGWFLGAAVVPAAGVWARIVGGLIGVAIGFSLADALPRTLAVQNSEGVALSFARVARPLAALVYPIAHLSSLPWQWVMRIAGVERPDLSPWASDEEVRSATPDDEESAREEVEEAMLDAVSEFTGKVVREVMVPRTDMAALEDTATVAEAIAMIEAKGFSRLPMYHETIDDIRGVLYAKDLLSAIGKRERVLEAEVEGEDAGAQPPGADLVSISRPPYFVPETKPIDELFVEMRARTHIAIVADEYGGTAGLVTIEDLLEELVGEIFDEYDREEALLVDEGAGRYRVDARFPIDDVNELFGTEIDVDADTIGGVASAIAGHIPEVGEVVEVEGLKMTVLAREGTRVRQLEIESVVSPDDEEPSDA
jgi:putative hemolysin